MKYEIVYGSTPGELEKWVNSCIESGWTPIGGVCVTERQSTEDGYTVIVRAFYQAMALKNEGVQ